MFRTSLTVRRAAVADADGLGVVHADAWLAAHADVFGVASLREAAERRLRAWPGHLADPSGLGPLLLVAVEGSGDAERPVAFLNAGPGEQQSGMPEVLRSTPILMPGVRVPPQCSCRAGSTTWLGLRTATQCSGHRLVPGERAGAMRRTAGASPAGTGHGTSATGVSCRWWSTGTRCCSVALVSARLASVARGASSSS
ncbi:MAG: hypothetical protein JWN17_265 [Frankiales bacterium]|nr:hypothetical protein [Frankiales bacterium]